MPSSSPPSNGAPGSGVAPAFGGQIVALAANRPLALAEGEAYIVREGALDVFAADVRDGAATSRRRHVLRVEPDGLVFGMAASGGPHNVGLIGVGRIGTSLEKIGPESLAAPERAAQAVTLVAGWVTALSTGLSRGPTPQDMELIKADLEVTTDDENDVGAGDLLVWVRPAGHTVSYLGEADLPAIGEDMWVPLTPRTWVHAPAGVSLAAIHTAGALQRNLLWASLTGFHRLAVAYLALTESREESAERERIVRQDAADQRMVTRAVQGLTEVLPHGRAGVAAGEITGDSLFNVCQVVADAAGIELKAGTSQSESTDMKLRLGAIARNSRFRIRPVSLEGAWWEQDAGPLIAFMKEGGQPVALIPESAKHYLLIDPNAGTEVRVTRAVAKKIDPQAVAVYRPFPDLALTVWDILGYSRRRLTGEFMVVLGLGLLGGIVGLVTPIATGIIFDSLVPSADRHRLLQMTVALLVVAIAAGIFEATRSVAMLRISGKVDGALQSATWDRLLSLPVPFFRKYTAGDLALRANAVNSIQAVLTGVVLSTLLSGLFTLFSLALMFYYERRLAITAVVLVAFIVAVTGIANYLQLHRQRTLLRTQGLISGMVLQLINGIAKLRIAGAEPRAFARWAGRFAEYRRLTFRARRIAYSVGVFNSGFGVVATLVIFFTIAFWPNPKFDTGTFLSFNAAFGQFIAAVLAIAGAVTESISVVPLYERARPILSALPEVDGAKIDPGPLKGDIEVNRIHFRYRDDGPVVLHDLSLSIKRGEFVALVGPSGAGKSTIFRMLLGFETPSPGTIFYDGQDLAGLDLRDVRRQIGVVLQNGKLLWGSIYQNIVGAAPLTMDDAWEAARAAGLEADIQAMPMGMQTFIGEGAATISGGQRQRLMIARAIVTKPRIILFDEATSSMDNETQSIVSDSLAQLNVTRVVIAQRLSTVIKADKIYVIDAGRVVETGNYQTLMAQNGLFASMTRRQLA